MLNMLKANFAVLLLVLGAASSVKGSSSATNFTSLCYVRYDCQDYPCPINASSSSSSSSSSNSSSAPAAGATNGTLLPTSDLIAVTGALSHGAAHDSFIATMAAGADLVMGRQAALGCSYAERGARLHTTLKYFCCHTKQELVAMRPTIAAYVRATPLSFRFDRFSCNLFAANHSTYDFFALLDGPSNAAAQAWAAGLEAALGAAGFNATHKPRAAETPFHSTLAEGCPVAGLPTRPPLLSPLLATAGEASPADTAAAMLQALADMVAAQPGGAFMSGTMQVEFDFMNNPLAFFPAEQS